MQRLKNNKHQVKTILKENPLRPIIIAVGTYTHSLAKYLVEILTPEFMDYQFILTDTFDFVNRVSEVQLIKNGHLISFDIESLFTYISTDETIESILNKIFTSPEPDKIRTGKSGRPAYPDRSLFHKFN